MNDGGLTRRQVIGAGFAAAAAVATVDLAPRVAHAEELTPTFALDPTRVDCGPGVKSPKTGIVAVGDSGSCQACAACRKHGANKLFKTKEAAELMRAHTGCRCAIVRGQALSPAVFKNVFARADSADRRHKDTREFLAAGVERHSVPLVSGTLPLVALVGGAAGIILVAARRHREVPPAA